MRVYGRVKTTIFAVLVALAASCAPRVEPVEVEFAGLEVEEMKRAAVELKLYNPNRFGVDIENLGYFVLLEADTVARGRRDGPLHVAPRDTTTASFPFAFDLDPGDVISGVLAGEADTVRLELAGRYSVPGFLGPKKQRFSYRHELSIAGLFEEWTRPLRKLFGGDGSD